MTVYLRALLLATVVVFVSDGVAAQNGRSGTSSAPAPTGLLIPGNSRDPEALDPELIHRREEARKVERKKRMVDSANRLLVLSQQLQTDLKGREATPEDQKKLDDIAKLARQVKDQMRN